jgi:hypothetical protein
MNVEQIFEKLAQSRDNYRRIEFNKNEHLDAHQLEQLHELIQHHPFVSDIRWCDFSMQDEENEARSKELMLDIEAKLRRNVFDYTRNPPDLYHLVLCHHTQLVHSDEQLQKKEKWSELRITSDGFPQLAPFIEQINSLLENWHILKV